MDHYADDLAALTAHLDLRDAVHVGHSTGGREVVHYIARHGESRVAKAVLINAVPPLMVQTEANPGGLPKSVFDDLQAQLAANRSVFYHAFASGPFYGFNRPGVEASEPIIQNWWRQGMMGGAKAHYDGIVAFSQTDFTEDLKKISVPVLVMPGDDDQIVPYAVGGNLTRFYVANEFAGGSNFLYLAWERSNVLGSANMDFEINKLAQPNLTTTGPKTLNRSAGDLLITFDFGGSGSPVLGLLRWVTTGATSQCFSANSLPCWGNRVDLTAANEAEGAVNSTTVTDPIAGVSLPAGTFGEAAVNLTQAGVFPPGTCTAFGSTFLKSRSSASFPAEVKDFVAPQPVNISNCGTIVIKKVTVPSPDPTNTSFDFTLNGGGNPAPTGTTFPKTFSLTNGGSNSTQVFAGSGYSAAETVPANWVLTSATCDNGSPVTNINVNPSETVTCTFTNTLQTGAIQVTKTFKHAAAGSGDHPQPEVTFTVNGVSKVTDANGVACFDGLLFDTYTVHETVPAGYHGEADKQVTVDNTATCAGNPFGGETVSFHNTPLTNITTSVDSQVDGGTSSTITCVDSGNNTVASGSTGTNGDGSATASNLEPGTYTCTVVVDP
jgi:alpha/beta hydrolase fold/Prealbumin-like fold domain